MGQARAGGPAPPEPFGTDRRTLPSRDGVVACPMVVEGDRTEKLLDAGLALASDLSLPSVLQRIVELAADVTSARYVALGVLGPAGRIIEFVTHGITPEQRAHIGSLPIGRGILGALITDARPLRLREISADPRSVGFPPNHPDMHSFLGAPVKAGGRVYGNIYLTQKQGAPKFTEEDERALVVLAAQAGVAVQNAHLYEEARQRERRLEATHEITAAILESQEPKRILKLVAERARELVGGSLAAVSIPTEDGLSLVIEVAEGVTAEALQGLTYPIENSVSGEVVQTGKPIALKDASADERAYQPMIRLGEIGPALFVPLGAPGRPIGTLTVGNPIGGRELSVEDMALIQTFAGQASLALEYARAQRELQRLTVMEDRERIAKELHDGVIQSLFAVGMGLQATATMSGDDVLGQRIESAIGEIDRVIRDLRNYIFGLRPGLLADRQLDQALRRLGEELQEQSGVTTIVEVDPTAAAELASVGPDILQFARESLSNVRRHAQAMTCRLSLFRRSDTAVLEIDDDGKGFDPMMESGSGQGLGNLKERAASLGGEFVVESRPGEGTTVRLTIPLP